VPSVTQVKYHFGGKGADQWDWVNRNSHAIDVQTAIVLRLFAPGR
jgi:hypothetical protein